MTDRTERGSVPVPSELIAGGLGALAALLYLSIAVERGGVANVCLAVLACGITAALLFWRRYAIVAGSVIFVLLAVWAVVFWTALPYNTGITPFLLTAPLVVYAWTRWAPTPRWGWAALLVGLAGTFASPAMYGPVPQAGFEYLLWRAVTHWSVLAVVFLAARGIRSAAESARQRAVDLSRAAAAAERERIARELHDVLAHGLTLIRAQALAGEITARTDPEAGLASLHTIAAAAGDSLTDVRAIVSLLRETDSTDHTGSTPPSPPLPSADLTALPQLIDAFTGTGLRFTVTMPSAVDVAAAQARLPLAVRLAVLRVIQEGLTNACRHAPADSHTHLDVALSEAEITVCVDTQPGTNAPEPAVTPAADSAATPVADSAVTPVAARGPGWGLTGLSERLSLLGGRCTAGPTTGGGFRLTAVIPTRERQP